MKKKNTANERFQQLNVTKWWIFPRGFIICIWSHSQNVSCLDSVPANVPIFYLFETSADLWFSIVFKWYKMKTLARNSSKNNSIYCATKNP